MKIFKGDDTGGRLGKALTITVHTRYDLTNCLIFFNYQGITRKWEGVKDGDTLDLFFSHNETARMSVGTFKGVMFAIDPAGKYRTIDNAIPITVTTSLRDCYGDDHFDVVVGVAVDWNNIVHKPFEGQTIDLSTDDKMLAALGTIIEKLGGTVKTIAILALASFFVSSAFAYDPPVNDKSYTTNGVTYAQRGGLGVKDYVVTNISIKASDIGAVEDNDDYQIVKSNATTAVQPSAISDMETKTHASDTYQPKGDYLTEEEDPTVKEWAKADTKPSYSAREVGALPDNQSELEANENFKSAVAAVSPPVVLPEKWALANVTNAEGGVVSAADVGALSEEEDPYFTQFKSGTSVAIGRSSRVGGTGVSIGSNASSAGGIASVAIGTYATAGQNYSAAIGYGANASRPYSLAIGMGAVATNFAAVSIGAGTDEYIDEVVRSHGNGTFNIGAKSLDKVWLGETNLETLVKGAVPPVELPEKWALSNITNDNGQAVGAADVGAFPKDGGTITDGNSSVKIDAAGIELRKEYGTFGDINLYAGEGVQVGGWFWRGTHFEYNGTFLMLPYGVSGELAVNSWSSLRSMLTDATTNPNADIECISTNICKIIEPAITNAVIYTRDRFYDAELDVTWKRTVSGGRIFYDIESVGDSTGE